MIFVYCPSKNTPGRWWHGARCSILCKSFFLLLTLERFGDLERRKNVLTGNCVTAGATFYLHIWFPTNVFLAPLAALTRLPPAPVCLSKVWPLCSTCVHRPPSLKANCCVHLCVLAASWFLNVLVNYYRFCLDWMSVVLLLCSQRNQRGFSSQYWFKFKAESYCIITWSTSVVVCAGALHWSC